MSEAELRALAGCMTVGIFAPVIGTFLVQKRLSLVGDGIGHVAFAGVGAGLVLGLWPVWTALAFAVVGAAGVELLRARKRASGDLALALFFYAGLALGAVFASRAGDLEDLEGYLFGDPLSITASGLASVLVLAVGVLSFVWLGRRILFAVATDEDWARTQGLPVDRVNLALSCLAAAVVVAGMQVVGLLLIAALLVMPVASAQLLARSFRGTLVLSSLIGAASAAIGLLVGVAFGVAPGGLIVLLASAVFAISALTTRRAPRTLRQEEHA